MSSSSKIASSILVASFSGVAKVFLVSGVGYLAVKFPRENPLIPRDMIGAMSRFTFVCLNIPLIYVALGSTLTLELLRSLWFIPLSGVVLICISYVTAAALGMIPYFRMGDMTDRSALNIAASFPNVVSIPLLMFPNLCEYEAMYDAVNRDLGDDSISLDASKEEKVRACTNAANAMVFTYFFAWSLMFYGLGAPRLMACGKRRIHSRRETDTARVLDRTNEEPLEEVIPPNTATDQVSSYKRTKSSMMSVMLVLIETVISPGFVATMLGLGTALIPPLQSAMFEPGGRLRFLGSALESLAQAAPALMAMLVASSLVQSVEEGPIELVHTVEEGPNEPVQTDEEGTREEVVTSHNSAFRTHVWFCLSRLIITPGIVFALLVWLDCSMPFFGVYVPHMSKLVLLLNSCLPGALTVVVFLKSEGFADTAEDVVRVYLPSYLLSVFTIAGWASLGLLISVPREDSTNFCGV